MHFSADTKSPMKPSVYLIDNNSDQPRKKFDEAKLVELANSIAQHGIVQPIIVRKVGERYSIIAGERRFRAARRAGLNEVPVIVREMDEQQVLEVSLIENLQRENLNALEEAAAIRTLMDEHDLTQDEVAKRLGKSRPAIANAVRLLSLPEELQALVLEDEELMIKLAGLAAAEGWSVRETERRVADALDAKKLEKRQPKREKLSTDMKSAQDSLREHLGTKVRFRGDENKGKIVIEYYSKDELAGIYDRIMGN